MPSQQFLQNAMEQLLVSSEGKSSQELVEAAQSAISALSQSETLETFSIIINPLRLALESKIPALIIIAIECLGKFFTNNYWCGRELKKITVNESEILNDQFSNTSTDESVIHTILDEDSEKSPAEDEDVLKFILYMICNSFNDGETTDNRIQMQIIKALGAAISAAHPSPLLHSTLLLKALRTTYTIFLMSKNTNVQVAAQAMATQMAQTVFNRVSKIDIISINDSLNEVPNAQIILTDPEKQAQNIISNIATPQSHSSVRSSTEILNFTMDNQKTGENNDLIRDAFLLFRALCKLSMKPIPNSESSSDVRSQAMRSKLLALHLVNTLLINHLPVFLVPSPILFTPQANTNLESVRFINSVKQYICLSLSRNTVSVVPQVFDIAIEIFCRLLTNLRFVLKRELSVLFSEIVIPIVEARNSITFHQQFSLIKTFHRFLVDPKSDSGRLLVEIYLNYDCDVNASARENVWERLITSLSKLITQHIASNRVEIKEKVSTPGTPISSEENIFPEITTEKLGNFSRDIIREKLSSIGDFPELKKKALELVVQGSLESLINWAVFRSQVVNESNHSVDYTKADESGTLDLKESTLKDNSIIEDNNPTAFETIKHQKQIIVDGIQKFNINPKKGMKYLLQADYLLKRTPESIAKFLMNTPGLNKAMIGEFLGDGDEDNIKVMHFFVDLLNFEKLSFVSALRSFLQSFRLPGEAQKIDRFMLKFADRYVKDNPTIFESADTAYVLAYSVIMLNTDLHNKQVKIKMSKSDFLKNNRGIDNGKDISNEQLEQIYDDIKTDEIVLKDEREKMNETDSSTFMESRRRIDSVQQYAATSESMALKTEAILNNLNGLSENTDLFYFANNYVHLKPMFESVWPALLAGISWPFNDTTDLETIQFALEGLKFCIRISCMFEMHLEKKAFISTLCKQIQLSNINEMKGGKTIAAFKTLLEVAYVEGNDLDEAWKDVVKCISILDKLQITSSEALPEVLEMPIDRKNSIDIKTTLKPVDSKNSKQSAFFDAVAAQASSQEMTILVDRIFNNSINLSGNAIVEFIRYLCEISWEEISSSSDREHPRMYCLQRLIEISFYNMNRIRLEWVNIWNILGDHFNRVGCHINSNVSFFALDKLRQLSQNFLDLEELSNFKFQKEFLKPFEETLYKNPDPKIKDMVLACIQQLLQAKSSRLKSGWKTIFATLIKAAKERFEPIVILAFDIVKSIYSTNFELVVSNGAFPDFVSCLVEFCKNEKQIKTSLQAIELFKQSIGRVTQIVQSSGSSHSLNTKPSENLTELMQQGLLSIQNIHNSSSPSHNLKPVLDDDPNIRFWFPIFFGLYEVIMLCDLEVRSRAVIYLFESLKNHGSSFSHDFWEVIAKGVIFPIFDDLRLSRQEHTKFANKEDMSVWLSTTLIQALRQLVELLTFYFNKLKFILSEVLDILVVCMTQENETLSRIGSTCLQQLIEKNMTKFTDMEWSKIFDTFLYLLEITTPHALFFNVNDNNESPGSSSAVSQSVKGRIRGEKPKAKDFQRIIVKCILHLLILQTIQEIVMANNGLVLQTVKTKYVIKLVDGIYESYKFAEEFNGDMDLRMALLDIGFMKQLPNLLKQETASIFIYMWILGQVYSSSSEENHAFRDQIELRLIPKAGKFLKEFNLFDHETKKRNIVAWTPVIQGTMDLIINFSDDDFKRHLPIFFKPLVDLMIRDLDQGFRMCLHKIMLRVGELLLPSEQSFEADLTTP